MWATAVHEIFEGNVINGIFTLVMAFVSSLVSIILYPFSLIVKNVMPDLDTALSALGQYFEYAGTYLAWLLDALAIPSIVVTMIAAYWLFVFTTTFGAWSVKLILKWKKSLWV